MQHTTDGETDGFFPGRWLTKDEIYRTLPYGENWHFLDGAYLCREYAEGLVHWADHPMSGGHFSDIPVTPAAILTEAFGHAAVLHAATVGDVSMREKRMLPRYANIEFVSVAFPGEFRVTARPEPETVTAGKRTPAEKTPVHGTRVPFRPKKREKRRPLCAPM